MIQKEYLKPISISSEDIEMEFPLISPTSEALKTKAWMKTYKDPAGADLIFAENRIKTEQPIGIKLGLEWFTFPKGQIIACLDQYGETYYLPVEELKRGDMLCPPLFARHKTSEEKNNYERVLNYIAIRLKIPDRDKSNSLSELLALADYYAGVSWRLDKLKDRFPTLVELISTRTLTTFKTPLAASWHDRISSTISIRSDGKEKKKRVFIYSVNNSALIPKDYYEQTPIPLSSLCRYWQQGLIPLTLEEKYKECIFSRYRVNGVDHMKDSDKQPFSIIETSQDGPVLFQTRVFTLISHV